jgi:hypothetical protein
MVLAYIEYAYENNDRAAVWRSRETGATVLTLVGPRLETRDVPQDRRAALSLMDLHSYPIKDGRALHAHMRVNRIAFAEPLVAPKVRVTFGDDPRAAPLKALKLGRCVQYLYAPRCQGILFRPEPVEGGSS